MSHDLGPMNMSNVGSFDMRSVGNERRVNWYHFKRDKVVRLYDNLSWLCTQNIVKTRSAANTKTSKYYSQTNNRSIADQPIRSLKF